MEFGQFIQGEVRITQAAFASKILSQAVCFALGSVTLPSVFSWKRYVRAAAFTRSVLYCAPPLLISERTSLQF